MSGSAGDARIGSRASPLFYCRTDRCYLLLDLERDRYLALDAAVIDAAGGAARHAVLSKAIAPPALPRATTTLLTTAPLSERRRATLETVRFWSCGWWTARHLAPGSLAETVRCVKRMRDHPAGCLEVSQTQAAVARFNALRPWYPRDAQCLFDSLALLHFLSHVNLFPAWVFGVQEEPFEAHCWLQAGEVVLNDTLDVVSHFTPIMIV